MSWWHQWVRNTFGFSRGETRALFVLLPLMFMLIFVVPLYQAWFVRHSEVKPPSIVVLDSLGVEPVSNQPTNQPRLFRFDPNTATREELIELGFKTYLADRLIRYRAKKTFYQKEDLKTLYGLNENFYQQLEPYIVIHNADQLGYRHRQIKPTTAKPTLDLNAADTVQLKTIYGIGVKLSQRIVNYREKLGGFVNADQLYEVYGLDSGVVDLIKMKFFVATEFAPRKIAINTVAEKELSQHPYIGIIPGRLISAYRFQHGHIVDWQQLKSIRAIDTVKLRRALPYLQFE